MTMMTDTMILEAMRIELFCDADERGRLKPEEAEKFCPTLEEAMMYGTREMS